MVVVGYKVRYSCHLCSKTFPTNRGLKIHIHSHRSQGKSMQLSRRVQQPKVQTYLQTNRHRTVQKPHTCPLCERGSTNRSDQPNNNIKMDTDLCNTYTWVPFLGLSDSTYLKSVFPCNEEFEPIHKKQRLSNEVENDQITHFGCSVNIPQYIELTPSITSCQEDKGVCHIFVKHVKQRHPKYFVSWVVNIQNCACLI